MGLYSDVTLSDSQYIPQYTGLPLDTVRDVSDTLAERHYQNLARMDQLSLLAQQQRTQVLPGDRWYVDQQLNDIRGALGEIAKSGGENATARVAAIANRYMGDENILTSLQRAGDVQKELDVEAQLRAAGKTPVRRAGAREKLQAGIINQETGAIADEAFRAPYQSTAEAFVSPTPEMEEIWSVIKPDEWYTGLTADEKTKFSDLMGSGKISPDMDMSLFFKVVRSAGISTDKIEKMLPSAYSSYKNQPSYRQQTGLLGKTDDELRRDMFKHGLLRVFGSATPQYIQSSIADDALRAQLKGKPGLPYEAVPGMTIENIFGYDPEDMLPGTEPDVFDRMKAAATSGVGAPVGPGFPAPAIYQQPGASDAQKAKFYEDARTASEVYGAALPADTSKWTTEDATKAVGLVKQYQQLVEKRVSVPYRSQYDPDQIRENSIITKAAITGRVVYDMDNGEKISVKDNKGRLKEEFSEIVTDPEKFSVSGKMGPKDPFILKAGPEFAQAEYGQIWDSKNSHFKNILITPAAGELESLEGNMARNTAIVYSSVNMKPGSWQNFKPSIYGRGGKVSELPEVKARELIGSQFSTALASLPANEQDAFRQSGMMIEATVDGETWHFTSPEHLSQYILSKHFSK